MWSNDYGYFQSRTDHWLTRSIVIVITYIYIYIFR